MYLGANGISRGLVSNLMKCVMVNRKLCDGGDWLPSKGMNCLLLFQEGDDKKDKSKEKKKVVVKTIELPIEAQTHGYSQSELNNYQEQEVYSTNLAIKPKSCVISV